MLFKFPRAEHEKSHSGGGGEGRGERGEGGERRERGGGSLESTGSFCYVLFEFLGVLSYPPEILLRRRTFQ